MPSLVLRHIRLCEVDSNFVRILRAQTERLLPGDGLRFSTVFRVENLYPLVLVLKVPGPEDCDVTVSVEEDHLQDNGESNMEVLLLQHLPLEAEPPPVVAVVGHHGLSYHTQAENVIGRVQWPLYQSEGKVSIIEVIGFTQLIHVSPHEPYLKVPSMTSSTMIWLILVKAAAVLLS